MLRFNNLVININQRWDYSSLEVWVIEMETTKQFNISINSEGEIERTEIPELQPLCIEAKLKPFLNLPSRFATVLFKGLAEYNERNGVKTVDQNMLEGKLKATEDHLKDLRDITRKLLKMGE